MATATRKRAHAPSKRRKAPQQPAPSPPVERFVVFFRHGIAEERSDGKPDAERALTYEGHARMKQIARGLEDLFPKADALLTSPLVRSAQTALWIAKAYRGRLHPEATDELLPERTATDLISYVRNVDALRPILVGHEPLLSSAVAALVGIDPRALDLKKGGCLGVRIPPDGPPVLEWALPPRILRRAKA
jgi:phosphohistidine phosphatase SixA